MSWIHPLLLFAFIIIDQAIITSHLFYHYVSDWTWILTYNLPYFLDSYKIDPFDDLPLNFL